MSIPQFYLDEAARAVAFVDPSMRLGRGGFACEEDEAHIGHDFSLPSVATALAFIDCGPALHVTLKHPRAKGSYALKHDAERWGKRLGFEPYVANGDLICAVLYRGVPIWHRDRRSPNCTVGLALVESQATLGRRLLVRYGCFQSSP